MNTYAKTYTRDGWTLTLDKREVFPDDPGNGTPAMVRAPDGSTATYGCVMDTGECEYATVPESIYNWLENMDTNIDAFLYN